MVHSPLVVIPSRMASTRLPGKALADIHGEPMIVHVLRRALEADVGPVVVAAGDAEIVDAVTAAGGHAVLTRADHPSGSDRIWEAVTRFDPDGRYDVIVNVQGDLPTIEASAVRATLSPLSAYADVDITTLAAVIEREEDTLNPNIVKAVVEMEPGASGGRALYFTRATAPTGEGPLLHHIGLYTYRREALSRFVSLPPASLERREKLEQLRALVGGMTLWVSVVATVPLGVDTPKELDQARALLAPRCA